MFDVNKLNKIEFAHYCHAIERANERCRKDRDGFVVLRDMLSGEFITQTYVAARPSCTMKVFEVWPE